MHTKALPFYYIAPMYRTWAVVGGALLTWVLMLVRVPLPFTPVPITMQTISVLLMGALLGRGLGGLSQLTYVLLGIAGLPVFTSGGGLLALAGPTGGYLVGYVLAAFALSFLFQSDRRYTWWDSVWRMSVGMAIIYIFGLTHLGILTQRPLNELLIIGFWPFLPGAVAKLCMAVGIFRLAHSPVRRWLSAD